MERERSRQIKADLEASDSDDDLEPWARRLYRSSRRAEERRRKRREEEISDAKDREKEKEDLEAKRRKQHEDESIDEGEIWPLDNGEAMSEKEDHDLLLEMANDDEGDALSAAPEVDPNDPIYQAMIAAALSVPKKPSPLPSPHLENLSPAIASTTPPQPEMPTQHTSANPNNSALADMFGDDDDEQPERQLRPIQYTEEEVQAARVGGSMDDPRQAKKGLMDTIPTSKEGVFRYAIKWDAYESGTLGPNISKWVSKKIYELLGVEEPTLVNFIMGKLDDHFSPKNMMEELGMVLDEEAETFVIKLYRMVIYETEKSALGFDA